jgi:hypothetical protein
MKTRRLDPHRVPPAKLLRMLNQPGLRFPFVVEDGASNPVLRSHEDFAGYLHGFLDLRTPPPIPPSLRRAS